MSSFANSSIHPPPHRGDVSRWQNFADVEEKTTHLCCWGLTRGFPWWAHHSSTIFIHMCGWYCARIHDEVLDWQPPDSLLGERHAVGWWRLTLPLFPWGTGFWGSFQGTPLGVGRGRGTHQWMNEFLYLSLSNIILLLAFVLLGLLTCTTPTY